jgi:hypothetical protein
MKRALLLLLLVTAGMAGWCQPPATGNVGTPPKKKVSPLAEYVGAWTARLNGVIWLQLTLELHGEQLTGSLVHPRNLELQDSGEVKSFSEEHSTETVTDATLNPDGLLVTVKDADTQETGRYLMRLVLPEKQAADLKMIAEVMPPGMPKPKPWRLVKAGAAPTNPTPGAR